MNPTPIDCFIYDLPTSCDCATRVTVYPVGITDTFLRCDACSNTLQAHIESRIERNRFLCEDCSKEVPEGHRRCDLCLEMRIVTDLNTWSTSNESEEPQYAPRSPQPSIDDDSSSDDDSEDTVYIHNGPTRFGIKCDYMFLQGKHAQKLCGRGCQKGSTRCRHHR